MRRTWIGLAVALLGLTFGTSPGRAQAVGGSGVFSDPFSLYYGLYLPRQAAIASQTTSTDIIGAASVNQQASILESDRANGLFGDIQPFGIEDLDPTNTFGAKRNRALMNRVATHSQGRSGHGPPRYYGTSNGITRYYPNMKSGNGANRNTAMTRGTVGQSGRSGLMGMGMNQGMGSSGGYR